MSEQRYRIVRLYQDNRERKIIKSGLTLKEAQEHCRNPETSSRTAKHSRETGDWFDGYEKE